MTHADVQEITPKNESTQRRTKVTVTDGKFKCTALLATQLKELVDSGQIARGAVIEVHELVGNKKVAPNAAAPPKRYGLGAEGKAEVPARHVPLVPGHTSWGFLSGGIKSVCVFHRAFCTTSLHTYVPAADL